MRHILIHKHRGIIGKCTGVKGKLFHLKKKYDPAIIKT